MLAVLFSVYLLAAGVAVADTTPASADPELVSVTAIFVCGRMYGAFIVFSDGRSLTTDDFDIIAAAAEKIDKSKRFRITIENKKLCPLET